MNLRVRTVEPERDLPIGKDVDAPHPRGEGEQGAQGEAQLAVISVAAQVGGG
jgi:predicted  nucleic acid-binding Zn-ribbon protein